MRTLSLEHRWGNAAPVSAGASVDISEDLVTVDFAVKEAPSCFCQSKEQDGEAVWQDSCVEVFLKTPRGEEYINLEFNSKGACYGARGKNRQNRTEFSKSEYAQIIRRPSGLFEDGKFYRWMLSVEIPSSLLGAGIRDLRNIELEGNLYKCADLAAEPHWLTAFPINTPEPDFHRPEFFSPFIPFVYK